MSNTQTTLTVSYVLSPPKETNAPPSLSPKYVHEFTVEAEKTATAGYYEALHKSIVAAREKLGQELTAWRDAVGNAEAGKEKAAKAVRADDEEEEEEEEEQEEEQNYSL